MLGASAGEGHVPSAFRGWGAPVEHDAGQLRALVSCDASGTVGGVAAGDHLAFVLTDIVTYQSVQVKGRALGPAEPPNEGDLATMRRYSEVFSRRTSAIGLPPTLI